MYVGLCVGGSDRYWCNVADCETDVWGLIYQRAVHVQSPMPMFQWTACFVLNQPACNVITASMNGL